VAEGLRVRVFAGCLEAPRGLLQTSWGDVLVVEAIAGRITALWDSDGDGLADSRAVVATAPSLNHGLAFSGGFLYASSDTTVYRWALADGSRAGADREVVIHSMNANGNGGAPRGHWTRTLEFDSLGRLYVSIGSAGNVDRDSFRARIRRFDLPGGLPPGGIGFASGEIFADGLRNEVGLAFDSHGVLWGVENGADNLWRTDLGGDIHNDNPAEELNRFPESDAGKHYGYPWCWTEYQLASGLGQGPGAVWAWPSTMGDGVHTDAWCRANSVPPALALPAHWAPLGITFYNGTVDATCADSALPTGWRGHAFIASHGSWNRDVPTGYKVVRVPFSNPGDAAPSGKPQDILRHNGSGAKWPSGVRPVDVKFDLCGQLLVSSDGTKKAGRYTEGQIFIISPSASGTTTSTSTTQWQASSGTATSTTQWQTSSIQAGAGTTSTSISCQSCPDQVNAAPIPAGKHCTWLAVLASFVGRSVGRQ